MKEKQLEIKVHDYLREHDYLVFKNHGSLYSGDGRPDLEALKDQQLYGLELKAGTGHKLSLIQLWTLLKLSQHGAKSAVVFPDLLDQPLSTITKTLEIPVSTAELKKKSPAEAGIDITKTLMQVAAEIDKAKQSCWITWKNE